MRGKGLTGVLTFNILGGLVIIVEDWAFPRHVEIDADSHDCWCRME